MFPPLTNDKTLLEVNVCILYSPVKVIFPPEADTKAAGAGITELLAVLYAPVPDELIAATWKV
jgi:hypothetical protein